MVVYTTVLVHDIRYFVVAYAIAIGAAFLAPALESLKLVVAVVLIGIYVWYVKGHLTRRRRRPRATSRLSGSTGPTGAPIGVTRPGPRGLRLDRDRGLAARLRVGGDRVHRLGGDLRPDVATGPGSSAGPCSLAGCCTWATSVSCGRDRQVLPIG